MSDILSPPDTKSEKYIPHDDGVTVIINKSRGISIDILLKDRKWYFTLKHKENIIPITPSSQLPTFPSRNRDAHLKEELQNLGYTESEAKQEIRLLQKELASSGLIKDITEKANNKQEATKSRKKTTFNPETVTKAEEILKSGNPLVFVVATAHQNGAHIGDDEILETLFLSTLTPELEEQLHIMGIGSTEAGKSNIMEIALEFLPDEYVVDPSDPSPMSFYYARMSGANFDGCVIYVDDARAEHVPILKALASNRRRAPHLMTVKEQEPLDVVFDGSYSVWVSCVQPLRDEQGQITRRYLLVNPDETPEQDERVVHARKEKGRLGLGKKTLHPDFDVVKAIVQIIKESKKKVVIPFDFTFPYEKQRTNIGFFILLIHSVSKLFERQRVTTGSTILAEPSDFFTAARLWDSHLALQLRKIDKLALRVFEKVPENEPKEYYNPDTKGTDLIGVVATRQSIAKEMKESPSTIRDKLTELFKAGWLDYKKVGRSYVYWKSGQEKCREVSPTLAEASLDKQSISAFLGANLRTDGEERDLCVKQYLSHIENYLSRQFDTSKQGKEKGSIDKTEQGESSAQVLDILKGSKSKETEKEPQKEEPQKPPIPETPIEKPNDNTIEVTPEKTHLKIDQVILRRIIVETLHGSEKWRNVQLRMEHVDAFLSDCLTHSNLKGFDDVNRLKTAVIHFIREKKTPEQNGNGDLQNKITEAATKVSKSTKWRTWRQNLRKPGDHTAQNGSLRDEDEFIADCFEECPSLKEHEGKSRRLLHSFFMSFKEVEVQ